MSRAKAGQTTVLLPGEAEGAAEATDDRIVLNPFTIIVDSREKLPYLFEGLKTNADQGHKPIKVPLRFDKLDVGDYGLLGLPYVVIERKSKEDLYGSISQARGNFEERLRKMASLALAAVVIEAEWGEVLSNPPGFTQYNPKSLFRTILAWMVRYPRVHWLPMPGREAAESATFRLLERFFLAYQQGETFDQEYIANAENEAGLVGSVQPIGEVLSQQGEG